MDKEKQIEEMALDIIRSAGLGVEDKAKYLIEQGYRKINENEVVISKAEYNDLKGLEKRFDDYLMKEIIGTRKETAREILELLVPDCKSCDENWHNGCLCLRATLAEKIAKQFGVDLGEEV